MRRNRRVSRDDGAILPIVLVIATTLSVVVMSTATFVTADLRYGRVVEARADRLAAADGGLRYGIEKLRNFQTLCTTKAGSGGGFTTIFPPEINGATAEVTCRRVGNGISDVQGWGVVVTGSGVPAGQTLFTTQGAGGSSDNVKTFSGPVFVADPSRIDLQAKLEIKNGDLWYTSSNCDVPTAVPEIDSGYLAFTPDFFRGPLCTELKWDTGLFSAPTGGTVPTAPANPAPVPTVGCTVFGPGKYTSPPQLGDDNYFLAGDYYFENVTIDLQNQSLIAGFPANSGDTAKIASASCAAAQAADKQATLLAGGRGGATFYLGGSSKLNVLNGGELEIFRRKQGNTYLSILALDAPGAGYIASSLSFNAWILETKSGSNNDVAIHGLLWAPHTSVRLGNITNAANGQLLGGLVVATLDTQASASASAFAIGIESNPVDVKLLLISTATKDGAKTSIRAVIQYRPDNKDLAINSWRVTTG